jgi:hypothetical protein
LLGLFQQLDKVGGKAAKNPSCTDDLHHVYSINLYEEWLYGFNVLTDKP